jgi:hypothetical protein
MTEAPKGPPTPLEYGTQTPGVLCFYCGAGIGIGGSPAVLSDPFEARCLNCKKLAMYLKASIRILVAAPKQ